MKIAYCLECAPPVIVVAGEIPDKIRITVKGQSLMTDAPKPRHTVEGKVHSNIKVVDVGEDERRPGESPQAFLDRLTEAHKSKMT